MIAFRFEGETLYATKGQTVAAALLVNQELVTRHTRALGKPRGIFCGIGICFDCLLVINGVMNQRSCLVEISEGMVIEVQNGN